MIELMLQGALPSAFRTATAMCLKIELVFSVLLV